MKNHKVAFGHNQTEYRERNIGFNLAIPDKYGMASVGVPSFRRKLKEALATGAQKTSAKASGELPPEERDSGWGDFPFCTYKFYMPEDTEVLK